MQLNNLMIDSGDPIYYNAGMRSVFEDNMEYLRTHPTTDTVVVTAGLIYRHQNDLQGLFQEMKIPAALHFIVMRMNHFTSFVDNINEEFVLLVPNADEIAHMVQSYTSTNRII